MYVFGIPVLVAIGFGAGRLLGYRRGVEAGKARVLQEKSKLIRTAFQLGQISSMKEDDRG